MNNLQFYKQKTVLIKWTKEKIIVDIPFEVIDKAMTSDVLKIGTQHTIRTSAINERYGYNITDELEAWIVENYKEKYEEIMAVVKQRKKNNERVNKEVVVNIANELCREL